MQQLLLRNLKYFILLQILLLSFSDSWAQGFTVKGRITGDDGEGLPGVTVLLKGTSTGATTDPEGNYSLGLPSGAGTLVISFIGFQTQEVAVNNRASINISLKPDTKALDEVVVVGYGTQKKETVTGSVATVKGAELVKSPALNVSNSIAGRMPGVIAVNRSGEPGYDGSAIRIRGSNTLGNNDALVVIDGVPARQGGIERLNPADIENISVLKDASAAIYGARAANGVILVTTKRGKTGKPELSYSFNQGWSQPAIIPKLTDAAQFAELRNELEIFNLPVGEWQAASEAFRQNGSYTRANGSTINAPFKPDDFQKFRDGSDPWGHPNTDWYKATLKSWSPQSRHNMQLNGGTDNLKYLASIGYQNQDAFYRNSATGYKQYDMRVNLDAKVNKYISAQVGVLGRQENREFPTKPASTIFRMQMRGNPTQPAYWPNGLPGPDIENGENPVTITTNQTGYDRDTRYYFQSNGQIEITNPWIAGLKLTANAAIDKYIQRTKRWETPWTLYTRGSGFEADGVTPKLVAGKRGPAEPRLRLGNEDQLNILLGTLLSYDRTIGNHTFTLLAGANRETINNDNFYAFRRFFISPAIDQLFAGGAPEQDNGGSAWERARMNYFGRVAYNYKEKYLAEFLWRYDGSYMFPENTRYGFFPGVMLGWQISEEDFWKNNIQAVNYLKLRGSWGQMGNDQIYYNGTLQEYQYLGTYGFGEYIINNQRQKTLIESRVPNNTVTWEVANNSNIGLEGQLLNGKIFFEIDAFLNKRTNILWQRNASIPQTTGMTLPAENIGKVNNKGWDLRIGYNGQVGEFRYNVAVNGGYAKNEIKFWDEAPGAPDWQRSTGAPMNTNLYYQYDGVFKDQADIDATTAVLDYSAITGTLRPGDMKYKDYNNDKVINPDDRVRIDKNNTPRFQGGLNIGANFKNFDLTILFQGAAGALLPISTGEMGSIGNYLQDIYENRWTVANPSSEHPRIADRGNQYYSSGNTYWLRNNDYLRLKNLELGYTLPTSFGNKIGIGSLRVYVNGLNLLTFTKLEGFDPESDNSLGQYYPQSRILNTGVSVSF
ncbi:TonB-dependent receptor [Adhaeribacter swui]|uniref:TonB-dependent receptor n=1 Tax=Adhaeribacter swui TaxID=2086471 RepID=A0A7G7G4L7_9BACT|nr:TonB-dependent receptor [Adhaeribacter swui]QNF32101.1 TonB-dependent receptor [Adhaeribacter swui]